MAVLAIIPARTGSKGIPHKNFTPIAGLSPVERARRCVAEAGYRSVLTTDRWMEDYPDPWIHRPADLAQDDTPMQAVIEHVLSVVQGPPDEIILLVQPTQVLRQPEHLRRAVALLEQTHADSVVSVVPIPLTHSPDMVCKIVKDRLSSWGYPDDEGTMFWPLGMAAQRRQDAEPAYLRDGTVYAFWRRTFTKHKNIYGSRCLPLLLDPTETTPLDTPEDWAEAERRLRFRV